MIRKATTNDHKRLTEISFAAKKYWKYPSEYFTIWADELTITEQYIRANDVFVFEKGGQAIGYYSLVNLPGNTQIKGAILPSGLWLEHMFVIPESIGKDIGKDLFAHCVEKCLENLSGRLHILADPHAVGFYRKMGCIYLAEVASTIADRTTPYFQYIVPNNNAAVKKDNDVVYITLEVSQAHAVKPLWQQLNALHLRNSLYHKTHFASFTFEERISQLRRAEKVIIFCAERNTQIFAYCIASIHDNEGEIDSLFVEEGSRGCGVAGVLMETAHDWFTILGVRRFTVAVAHGNERVLPFYHKHGYRERMIVLTKES